MDDKKLLNNVTIKQEPNSSNAKKVLLSSTPFSPISAKKISNARLPSFKPPRDLFLTGTVSGNSNSTFNLNSNSNSKSTKRTFMPNIHVTRKKGSSEATINDLSMNNLKSKDRDKKKIPLNKKRNVNVVQTKGVFSEGLAPGKVKAFGNAYAERLNNEKQVLDKPKLNLNKKIQKTEEDTKLKLILKDDFIDDSCQIPDVSFIPNCLPMIYNVNPTENSRDLEKTFQSLQVKTEKTSNSSNEKPIITSEFENSQSPKIFLFEFPEIFKEKEDSLKKKRSSKEQTAETDKNNRNSENMTALGEGFFGYLRIHENGKMFLVIGKTTIPLCLTRHGTRQEIMSTSIDTESLKGEVINLGTIDASFTCSANIFQGVS